MNTMFESTVPVPAPGKPQFAEPGGTANRSPVYSNRKGSLRNYHSRNRGMSKLFLSLAFGFT